MPHGVTQEGPLAWLEFFDNGPGFFMAVNGQLASPNAAAAKEGTQDFAVGAYIAATRALAAHNGRVSLSANSRMTAPIGGEKYHLWSVSDMPVSSNLANCSGRIGRLK
jgi:hypothetical protein